jgi:RND family efflux transporter MFP subunit
MYRSASAAFPAAGRVIDQSHVRPPMFRPWHFLAFAALLSAAGITGLYLHQSDARVTPGIEPPVIAVTVARAEIRSLARSVIGDGSVVAWQELVVGAEAAGLRVVDVAVEEGDQVQRGQILMHFDAALLNAQVAQSEASVAEAQAALEFLRSDVSRAIALSRGAFIAAQTVEQRQSAAHQAEARLLLARARLDEATARLAQTQVVAPADGVVIRRSAQPGTVSAVGQEMFRMVRDGRLELDAKVPELELAAIKTGQSVRVLHGDEVVPATVRSVAPTVATDTRLGIVHISLPIGSGLRPGMFARVEINLDAAPGLAIPQAAVIFPDDVPAVFVLNGNGRVSLQRLTTGMRRDGFVEVLAGLVSGRTLITSGAGFLSDGDRVQVVTPLVVAEHGLKAGPPQ